MASDKKPYEILAERILAEMEKGVLPWQKPWMTPQMLEPYNGATGRHYQGGNRFLLMILGMEKGGDPRWLTYKQAQEKGWQVKKGSTAVTIAYVKRLNELERQMKDKDGRLVFDKNGEVKLKPELLIKGANVFHASQIEGIPEMKIETPRPEQEWKNLARVEELVGASRVNVYHLNSNDAYYVPGRDVIHMPERSLFKSQADYYGVLLHEMAHWTGHESRLNRFKPGLSGKEQKREYAREELRAELASVILTGKLGVQRGIEQSAGYIKSWIAIIKNDPFELVTAAAQAEKAADFIMKFDQSRDLSIENGVQKEVEEEADLMETVEVTENIKTLKR